MATASPYGVHPSNQWCEYLTNCSISIELYQLMGHLLGLAVVGRFPHAGAWAILPVRGEPHAHGGRDHGIVLRGR